MIEELNVEIDRLQWIESSRGEREHLSDSSLLRGSQAWGSRAGGRTHGGEPGIEGRANDALFPDHMRTYSGSPAVEEMLHGREPPVELRTHRGEGRASGGGPVSERRMQNGECTEQEDLELQMEDQV